MTYLDTSALIKLFVEEPGSALVARLVAEDPAVATAKIAYAELYAGLARKRRDGELSPRQHGQTVREIEAEWPAYLRLDLRDEILARARDLLQRHPLRGFDAIHLASAVALRDALDEEIRFVASDHRLLQAAHAERFAIVDVGASRPR